MILGDQERQSPSQALSQLAVADEAGTLFFQRLGLSGSRPSGDTRVKSKVKPVQCCDAGGYRSGEVMSPCDMGSWGVRARHRSLLLPNLPTSPNCTLLSGPERDLRSPEKRHDPGIWEARRALGPRSPGSGRPPHRSFSLSGALVAHLSEATQIHYSLNKSQLQNCGRLALIHPNLQ
jgi:hypothetical protein